MCWLLLKDKNIWILIEYTILMKRYSTSLINYVINFLHLDVKPHSFKRVKVRTNECSWVLQLFLWEVFEIFQEWPSSLIFLQVHFSLSRLCLWNRITSHPSLFLPFLWVFFFLPALSDTIYTQHCISLGVQHNDLSYVHHEVFSTVSLVNISDLI